MCCREVGLLGWCQRLQQKRMAAMGREYASEPGYQAFDLDHSHVRLCQMQARKFVAFFQALVFGLYQARQEARPS